MKELRKPRCLIRVSLGLILLATLVAETAAENGDRIDAGNGAVRYHISGIVDDPDPTTRVWARLGATAPSRTPLAGLADFDPDASAVANSVATATDPFTRTTVAAWIRNTETGSEIVVGRFDGTGWSVSVAVNGAPGNERALADPGIAVDAADGTVHLVYTALGSRLRVMHRQAPTDLSTWSAAVEVSAFGEMTAHPSVAVHSGRLWVAYENHFLGLGSSPREIVIANRRGGEPFQAETLASSFHSGPLRPAVRSFAGTLWVDWVDGIDQLAWARFARSGFWGPVAIEPFVDAVDRDLGARERIRSRATF